MLADVDVSKLCCKDGCLCHKEVNSLAIVVFDDQFVSWVKLQLLKEVIPPDGLFSGV